ncbi:MAG: LysM peptidoglycan-binding domain-containing protein [Candidatus Yanofskybacteria bacterium]|nr:LysM peptidoglycan-binding domain-containing protein [Candidatus Yanofskybacteria bacterium]
MRKFALTVVVFFILSNGYIFGATYKVKIGDNLTRISRKIGYSVEQIVTVNSIKNPDIIIPGQIIRYVDIEDIQLARLWLVTALSDPTLTQESYLVMKQTIRDLDGIWSKSNKNSSQTLGEILRITQLVRSSEKQLIDRQLINLNLCVNGAQFVLRNPPRVEIWSYPEIKKAVIYVSDFPGLYRLTLRNTIDLSDLFYVIQLDPFYVDLGNMVAISVINTDTELCPKNAEEVLLYLFQRKGYPFLLGIEALERLSRLSGLSHSYRLP